MLPPTFVSNLGDAAYRPSPLRPLVARMHHFTAYLSIRGLPHPQGPTDVLRRGVFDLSVSIDKVRLPNTRSRRTQCAKSERFDGPRRTETDISRTTRDSVTSEVQGARGWGFCPLSGMHSIYKFRSIMYSPPHAPWHGHDSMTENRTTRIPVTQLVAPRTSWKLNGCYQGRRNIALRGVRYVIAAFRSPTSNGMSSRQRWNARKNMPEPYPCMSS
ncbi:hypothetical protein LXA43DRAFT_620540 [Ganoderma leucocontextum]|nr:hypothetical protein LXA43DRAFT_620540 [Ganoderma leucocontextum]